MLCLQKPSVVAAGSIMVAGQAFTTQFTTVMKVCVHDTKEEYYEIVTDYEETSGDELAEDKSEGE